VRCRSCVSLRAQIAKDTAELGFLLDEVINPPLERVGALDICIRDLWVHSTAGAALVLGARCARDAEHDVVATALRDVVFARADDFGGIFGRRSRGEGCRWWPEEGARPTI
jgi:hypothetical protein